MLILLLGGIGLGNAQVEWFASPSDLRAAKRSQGYAQATVMSLSYATSTNTSRPGQLSLTEVSNLVTQLQMSKFRELLTNAFLAAKLTNSFPEYKCFACDMGGSVALHVATRTERSDAALTLVERGLDCYVSLRQDGHTAVYATAAVRAAGLPPADALGETEADRVARGFGVPPGWMRKSTKENLFYVIDGPTAWTHGDAPFRKMDAREFDPEFKAKLDLISSEVLKGGSMSGADYYDQVKWRMQRQHGLSWLSPLDLNEGVHIDIIQGK